MSQLYIRVRTNFFANKKTMRLRAILGRDNANNAYWIPQRLWAYAAENQPDGDMGHYTSEDLAMVLGCEKHAPIVLQALKDSGFIDPDGRIHDWEQHNGYHDKYAKRAKVAAEARWLKERSKEKKDIEGKRKEESGASNAQASPKHCLSIATSIQDTQSVEIPIKISKAKAAVEEVIAYCRELELPDSDGQTTFDKWEGNGWTNNGKPIKDWKATIRAWKQQNYMPSQRQQQGRLQIGQPAGERQASIWELQKRLEAINELIKPIERRGHEDAFGVHVLPKDAEEYSRLKSERKKIKEQMAKGTT